MNYGNNLSNTSVTFGEWKRKSLLATFMSFSTAFILIAVFKPHNPLIGVRGTINPTPSRTCWSSQQLRFPADPDLEESWVLASRLGIRVLCLWVEPINLDEPAYSHLLFMQARHAGVVSFKLPTAHPGHWGRHQRRTICAGCSAERNTKQDALKRPSCETLNHLRLKFLVYFQWIRFQVI